MNDGLKLKMYFWRCAQSQKWKRQRRYDAETRRCLPWSKTKCFFEISRRNTHLISEYSNNSSFFLLFLIFEVSYYWNSCESSMRDPFLLAFITVSSMTSDFYRQLQCTDSSKIEWTIPFTVHASLQSPSSDNV